MTKGDLLAEAAAVSKTDYPFQSSAGQCAAICRRLSGCKASSYVPGTDSCQFLGSSLTNSGFTARTTGDTWSDIACWDCPTCAAATADGNVGTTSGVTGTEGTSSTSTGAAGTPGENSSTPVETSTPGTPEPATSTPGTSFSTPGEETSTPVQTSTPGTAFSTPGEESGTPIQTSTPGTGFSEPGTASSTPGTAINTPVSTYTPGTASTPVNTPHSPSTYTPSTASNTPVNTPHTPVHTTYTPVQTSNTPAPTTATPAQITNTRSQATTSTSEAACTSTGYALVANPDPSYWCHTIGLYMYAYEADRGTFPNQKTSEDCAYICSQISTCKASTYRAQYDKCEFSDQLLTDAVFSHYEGGSYWSEQRCWDPEACLDNITPTTTSTSCTSTGYAIATDTVESDYVCESVGLYMYAYEADRGAFPNQKTAEDCAYICSQISTCKASTYRAQYDKCEFSDQFLTDAVFSHYEGGSPWSEQRCWNPTACLDAPATTSTACTSTGYVVPTNVDSGYVCRSFGLYRYAYEADRGSFPNQKTSEDCANICSQISICKASTYRAQYDKCEFSDQYLTDDVFFYHETGSYWYEQRCWDAHGCLDNRASSTTTSAASTTTTSCAETGYAVPADVDSSYVCGNLGLYMYAYEADRGSFPNQKTPQDCAAICAAIRTCKASTYRSQYDKCEFSDQYLTDDVFQYYEQGSDWYEQRCWDAHACLDSSGGANVLRVRGFPAFPELITKRSESTTLETLVRPTTSWT
ncbi:hypothetical protein B0T10DRAFT_491162 [Thelonectria olida]|uniref:Apple domain-containing protein n=1 Tax=Thelonectria olida TaxID=1576542 RepID=A0A9P8W3R9_9HYPO|nr:hypothetical protein B0T10DRAFT_491162 [Thelonectria olida]